MNHRQIRRQILLFIIIGILLVTGSVLYGFNYFRVSFFKSILTESTYLITDNLSNFYLINSKNELLKYDNNGNSAGTYNNKLSGTLSSISTYIPLEIFIFYKDIHQIVFLDKTLSQRGAINLEELGLKQVTLACPSFDKNIWIFDESFFELKKIDNNLKIIQNSSNITTLTDDKIEPNFLIEHNNMVYLNNPSAGILVFDIYASFYKNIPIKNLDDFQIIGNELYYLSNKQLHSFNLINLEEKIIDLPDTAALVKVRTEKERLYLLKDNKLDIYKF